MNIPTSKPFNMLKAVELGGLVIRTQSQNRHMSPHVRIPQEVSIKKVKFKTHNDGFSRTSLFRASILTFIHNAKCPVCDTFAEARGLPLA